MTKIGWLIIAISFGLVFLAGMGFEKRWSNSAVKPAVEIAAVQAVYNARVSDESVMSLYEALVFIDGAISSHQYYIDRPQLQNEGTGDTTSNERVIKQYKRLKALLTRIDDNR